VRRRIPPDACATANFSSGGWGIQHRDLCRRQRQGPFSLAERGARKHRGHQGKRTVGTSSGIQRPRCQNQPPNPHAGLTPDCPWPPSAPLPQAQQACGNATAKASYGDGNLAVAVPNGGPFLCMVRGVRRQLQTRRSLPRRGCQPPGLGPEPIYNKLRAPERLAPAMVATPTFW